MNKWGGCPLGCDVLLLSAGFGTRLRPLTLERPKPLIPFCGKAIIEWNLEILARSGVRRVFINLHYLPDQIKAYLGDGSRWNLELIYVLEESILETGGGIKNIEDRVTSEFLITVNSDIILDPAFNLHDLLQSFEINRVKYDNMLAMLVLTDCNEFDAKIGIAHGGQICQVLDSCSSKVVPIQRFEYIGVQIIARDLFNEMPTRGTAFSITRDLYRSIIRDGEERGLKLGSFIYDGFWTDVGTIERLREAEAEFSKRFLLGCGDGEVVK